jgi:hypothetical protein
MWETRTDTPQQGCLRVRTLTGGRPLSFAEAIEHWAGETSFRDWFSQLLLDAPFAAYCWETPPVARSSVDREFEFVLADAPALGRFRADPQPFSEQFARCDPGSSTVAFPNLGGDAVLVAPLPAGTGSEYSHLGSFLRSAPLSQRHALWQHVGTLIKERLGDDPLWVSTAGLGVSWLHVRLDSHPKYYRFDPYRSAA